MDRSERRARQDLKLLLALVAILVGSLSILSSAMAGNANRGSELATACVECHGQDGVGQKPEVPNLAGQNETYLLRQLNNFKSAVWVGETTTAAEGDGWRGFATVYERVHPIMGVMAASFDARALADLAAHFSSLSCHSSRAGEQAEPDPAPARTARCESCHGVSGQSDNDNIPNLAGQNRTYLFNQITSFQRSVRGAEPQPGVHRLHPVMGRQAVLLNEDEMAKLADYYASLPCR
ncbi:MAG: c-type cytochrome [Rhodospirillales bacterium]|nr:c-type cytochrome [Rhodospirillales bacterium]MCW8862179.1 c-type cytochrome [Rhodospirillales bacterium]MCW8952955.1 c-type cytochrome [Rhodospirillales bacterium]MCW8970549.1 c-type cytochrome [Rhodospirillales bacterium]